MTGPDHYLAAERLISIAKESENAPIAVGQILAEAQAHATLALAAATAMSAPDAMDDLDYLAWDMVCGVRAPEDEVTE